MSKRIGSVPQLITVGLVVTALASCGTTGQPSVGVDVPAPAPATDQVEVLSLTDLSGAVGRSLPQDSRFRAQRVADAGAFEAALATLRPRLLYANAAELPAQDSSRLEVLRLARDQGVPVLVEGTPTQVRDLTGRVFHFEGEQSGYVIRPLPGSDGGFTVVSLTANESSNDESVETQSLRQPDPRQDSTWLHTMLVPVPESDALTTSDDAVYVQGIPPSLSITRKWWGNEGRARVYAKGTTTVLARCSASAPCTDYTYSKPKKIFSAPGFRAAKWFGNWRICGSNAVDVNNSCSVSYLNSKISTKGSKDELGFTIGGEVNGEASVGSAFNPFTLFSEWKAKLAVKAEVRYSHTWERSKSSVYTEADNVIIKQGYRARFGEGEYTLNYKTSIVGRHERTTDMRYVGGQASPGCGGFITGDDWGVISCSLTYNPKFEGNIEAGKLVTLGAKVWAICKNTDTACITDFTKADKQDLPL
jgi:hypothetical protein